MEWKKFPSSLVKLDWKSTKTQNWNTTRQKAGSGKIRTMCNQTLPSWTIETKFNMLNDSQYKELLGFAALVKGGFEPFLWRDFEDYEEKNIELTSNADGIFQAVMRFGEWQEPVEYIENLSVVGEDIPKDRIRIEGGQFYIVDDTDFVIFRNQTITVNYTYYWLVRFAGDSMTVERIFYNISRSKSFKLEAVRI